MNSSSMQATVTVCTHGNLQVHAAATGTFLPEAEMSSVCRAHRETCPSPRLQAAGGAFGILFKGGGGAVDSVIPSLLAALSGDEAGQARADQRACCSRVPSHSSCTCPGHLVATSHALGQHPDTRGFRLTTSACCAQALAGLRVILSVRPSLLASMLPRLLKPPLTAADVTAVGALAEVAGGLARAAVFRSLWPLYRCRGLASTA